jgi:hypothetical protein
MHTHKHRYTHTHTHMTDIWTGKHTRTHTHTYIYMTDIYDRHIWQTYMTDIYDRHMDRQTYAHAHTHNVYMYIWSGQTHRHTDTHTQTHRLKMQLSITDGRCTLTVLVLFGDRSKRSRRHLFTRPNSINKSTHVIYKLWSANLDWNPCSGRSTTVEPGNTKGGNIIVPMTSCLTGLESAVW